MPQVQVESNQSMLDSFSSSLFNLLNTQSSLLSSIENKLHSIINLRMPEKPCEPKQDQQPAESVKEQFLIRLEKLQTNNDHLEKIYKHLSEII